MHLKPFEYAAPTSLHEALQLLAADTPRPAPLAGGTDLIVMMKEGRLRPPAMLSLKQVKELRGIQTEGDNCRIGAATTVAEVGESTLVQTNPSFGDAVRTMATPQIRNRATIGGNLCTSAACADFPPVLLINDAVLHLESSKGKRDVPIGGFFTGLREVDRHPDELLVTVSCRSHNPGSAYIKFGVRRAAVISIVGVAASLKLDNELITDLKVATTAACPTPDLIADACSLALGRPAADQTWQEVAEVVLHHLSPISDLRGSKGYRLHLAEVGTIRALRLATERFRGVADA